MKCKVLFINFNYHLDYPYDCDTNSFILYALSYRSSLSESNLLKSLYFNPFIKLKLNLKLHWFGVNKYLFQRLQGSQDSMNECWHLS